MRGIHPTPALLLALLATAATALAPAAGASHDCGGLRTATLTAEACDPESGSSGCSPTACWESYAAGHVVHVGAGAEGVRADGYVVTFERSYCENEGAYCSGYDSYGAGGATTTPLTGTTSHGATLVSYRTHGDGFESCQTYLFLFAGVEQSVLLHDGCDVTLVPLA